MYIKLTRFYGVFAPNSEYHARVTPSKWSREAQHAINVDEDHKLIRRYAVTDASVPNSRLFDELLDEENSGRSIRAYPSYRSEPREKMVRARSYQSRVHQKGNGRHRLNRKKQATNLRWPKVHSRVEQVSGDQRICQGGILTRAKGNARAAPRICLMNLT